MLSIFAMKNKNKKVISRLKNGGIKKKQNCKKNKVKGKDK